VETHLEAMGLSSTAAAPVGDFFRSCDAVCFAPVPSSENLPDAAERLILKLENESCPLLV
jgi:hypothetical protein